MPPIQRPLWRVFLCQLALILSPFSGMLWGQNNQVPIVPDDLSPNIEILQPGVKLTLLAEHPALVTPTGIDVDQEGRIWVAVCHTHFRPEPYPGPVHDEIFVFDRDGSQRRLFFNRTTATMHVELGSDGWVYLAERDRILRVRDSDGDGVGDQEETLAELATEADYPHNGLSGMAWHPDGGLVFSLGENFEKEWTLTARDGTSDKGRGEGGIFWCTRDGKSLRRLARGFWNPFGLMIRDNGEIFAAENDPGSRPPCRLLHIVEGGNYGYQRAYGNAPVHPFVAWNGELRGTLGMVHPAGEGPCAIAEFGGGVLIPSWSNHCIDYFPLTRRGASYSASRVELLRGSDHFRPVCMARGPDGAFYLTDWVYSSYQLHQRGRLWKLELDANSSWKKPDFDPVNEEARLADDLRQARRQLSADDLFRLARGKDPYLSDAALTALSRVAGEWTEASFLALDPNDQVWALLALRRRDPDDDRWIRLAIQQPSRELQFESLRWIADEVLTDWLPEVEGMLGRGDLDFPLFEASLAAWNTLQGKAAAGVTDVAVLAERLTRADVPLTQKAFLLRLLPPSNARITLPLLRKLYAAGDSSLALEVIRTLGEKEDGEAFAMLARIAGDPANSIEQRLEAITGLARSAEVEHHRQLLQWTTDSNGLVRREALRALRGRALPAGDRQSLESLKQKHPEHAESIDALLDPAAWAASHPPVEPLAGWLEAIAKVPGTPDIDAGRRIFFHSRLGACAGCHRHDGRGQVVGPDLSMIANQGALPDLLRSILEPNREVAPQYYTTLLELEDGSVFSGILLRSSSKEVYRDASGKERTFSKEEIVQRKESKTSLMPTDLARLFTAEELRDLLAFLTQRPSPP